MAQTCPERSQKATIDRLIITLNMTKVVQHIWDALRFENTDEWTHSYQGSGDRKVVVTFSHLTLAAHPLDYIQFRANGSHPAHAADRLIEDSVVAGVVYVSYQFLSGILFHPAAAYPPRAGRTRGNVNLKRSLRRRRSD